MKGRWIKLLFAVVLVVPGRALGGRVAAEPRAGPTAPRAHARLATITIDYPLEGSIFPPEITPPTFIWHDAAEDITRWRVEVAFGDGSPSIQVESRGEPMRIGEIDSRCIAKTNELPKLTPEQALAHTWTPDARTWEAIKSHSAVAPAAVTITGFREDQPPAALSHGRVAIQTSKDQVGAPIFYRDVPLMPFESKKGDIQPLAPQVIRLVQWQLRYIGEPRGRVVLKNLPTCGNCHSFSLDGKTMGMDVDGPQNSKGLYALVSVKPETTIRTADIVPWGVSHDNKGTPLGRVGFMSQVSPDGKHVVTTVQPAGRSRESNYYVINFKDYRFLQVFYPARGILAWYSRESGERRPLPGADDPRYVQTDGVWSPDGQYLVFARAEARDPNPPDGKLAEYANDPKELQIQYDLYRIPFNGGQGGQPEPIAGASRNGMSNTFPKVSPDGCWIVFVKCRNGQLMRPDSQLYIVPAQGGQARRMRCNTSLMNSWHSFSPNGRWMVFSSKSRSPYTQMFLTHIDEEGNDSPAILIDNSTAANRAVNLPEFVNIPPDGLTQISVPAVDMFYKFDHARELQAKGEFDAAIREWSELVQEDPSDHRFHNNLALSLVALGRNDEAIPEYKRAIELFPYSADTYCNLGLALAAKDRLDEATAAFEKSVQMNPNLLEAQYNLGVLLARQGQLEKALPHFQKAVEINSNSAEAQYDLAIALVSRGELAQALLHFAKTVEIKPEFTDAHYNLGNLLYAQARVQEALAQWREVLRLDPNYAPAMIQAAYALAASPEASDRNGAEAVKLAERALQLTGTDNPLYLDTLAAAYAEAGRFPEAIEAARKALELAKQHNQDELARTLNAKIGLYEARKPYRLTMEDSP